VSGFTNIACRKRAKTDDEKEQRRVERVLRNRRAAQSSRERKRQEVEALEKRNKELEAAFKEVQEHNARLIMQLQQARSSGLVTHSSPLESFRENPSLSQGLFSPQTTHSGVDELVSSNTTVDPTTLSPQLLPVAESFEDIPEQEPSKEAKLEQTESTSPDLTQRPAVSHVGGDAQVVPVIANLDGANIGLAPAASDDAAFSLGGAYVLPASIDTDRCVLESGYLSSPHSSIIGDDYMAGDTPAFSLNDDFDISVFFNDDANAISTESMATSDFAAATSSHEPQTYEPEIQVP
jgi:transcriptional activator HAC1